MLTSKFRFIWFFSLLLSLVWGSAASAADPKLTIKDDSYAAKFVSQSVSDPVTLEAGQSTSVTITFKNTGTATWNNGGARFISAYTVEPKYRDSEFESGSWVSSSQTGKMTGTVKPGATGKLTIDLTAPSTPGLYTEEFYLSTENYSWVKGGYFFLKINVTPAKTVVKTPAPEAKPVSLYKANVFRKVPQSVAAKGGESVELAVAVQNVGTKAWNGYQVLGGSPTALASVSTLSFADEIWEGPNTVFSRTNQINTDAVMNETIRFRTPAKAGEYVATFRLAVDGTAVEDGIIQIPVTVTENAPYYIDDPTAPPLEMTPLLPDAVPQPLQPRMSAEPRIRVGIWKKPDSYVQFYSADDDYTVYDGETAVGIMPRYGIGVLKYVNGQYTFKGGELDFATANYIHLAPANNPHAVFTLWNMERKIAWKGGSRNFNQYRGALEYRLTQDGKTMYAINDVLLEDYVAGIGETANLDPTEFLKAQAVAARTYAYFIANHSDKHDVRNFDVVATTGDQLYIGYVGETITPNYVAAVVATRGYMVTYEKNIVITPYFGHSNGKTKSWTQVWGGTQRPWLVPVVAKYDKGLRQYGHGVGMSQRDAMQRAKKDGTLWDGLIKIYYTGVEVEKMYL